MAKQQPDLRIDRLGTHLFQVTRKDGTNWLKWDWDKLLEEVQAATTIDVTIDAGVVKGLKKKGINVNKEVTQALAKEGLNADIKVKPATADRKVHYVDVGDLTPAEATKLVKKVTKAVKAKKDLVKETEAKVAKSRAKKADEHNSPLVDKTAKKATAKKSIAKKTAATKKSAK